MKMLQKLLKATAVTGLGMATETVSQSKALKPQSMFGCSFSRPTPQANLVLDEKNPLNLKKARLILRLDSKEVLVINNPVVLSIVKQIRREKWYHVYEQYDQYVLKPRNDYVRKQIHNVCTSYRNCQDISKEVYHSFDVASAIYYNLMKEKNAFPKTIVK